MNNIIKTEKSLMKSRWVMADVDFDEVTKISQKFQIPEIISRLLISREIREDKIEAFLNPTLARDFPDPSSMKDVDELSEYLAQAIIDKKPIGVFGDFDVDGATSSAVLKRFFRHYGMDVPIYIPDRMVEGYGPNIEALKKLKEQGCEIVLICDCGITSNEIIKQGKDLGLEIAILDHHEPDNSAGLPPADFVVDPKRADDKSGLGILAAVGVVFMVCVATNAKLREKGFQDASLKEMLDIVALGTVCDMVPLLGVNRMLVRAGFAQFMRSNNVGIKALMEVAGIDGGINSYHCGFVLGPRINAGSRVHKAELGAILLGTEDAEEAQNIAWILNDCNDKRKEIQKQMMERAIKQIDDRRLDKKSVIFVRDEKGHTGLSGLVAGRLKEQYKKPSIVVAFVKNGEGVVEGRGSGRCVAGVNLAAAFLEAKNAGILIKGGGHAMAGGFTIAPDKLDEFEEFMYDNISKQLENKDISVETVIDSMITVNGVKLEFIKMIYDKFGPFGQGHQEPLFLLSNVKISGVGVVGTNHVKCFVSDWEGGASMKAVAFGAMDNDLGEAMMKNKSLRQMDLVGNFKINKWQGRENIEFHIVDAVCN